jgi:hypothetical protein
MKKHLSVWAPSVVAILVSACGGIGEMQPRMDAAAGSGGTVGGGGTGGGGIVLGSGGMASAAGALDGGVAYSDPPPGLVPGIDGTWTYMPDGTGSISVTTTGSGIDAQIALPPGQLTAGTWDDNLNFSFYTSYVSTTAGTQLAGLPAIDRSNRMIILVKDAAGQPVAGAQVAVADSAGHVWQSTTGAEGRVLYFPAWATVAADTVVAITAVVAGDSVTQTATATAGTVELAFAHIGLPTIAALDLAFVIDTTGSMGDELAYLQSEVKNIVDGIATQFPGIAQRWALVAYRDTGDEYVVRRFDFVSDLATFRDQLAAQASNGGGDMPEAVDQALAAAGELGWRDGAVARVAFWIADAPHHAGRESAVISALAGAIAKGVHIYPVAASGIDDLGEFTMRTAAEVTGGRYLFLTNDSGIGGSHQEPHIPCYYVTTLASAMLRTVAAEVTGEHVAPAPTEIVRTGGDLQDQQCTLTDGGVVTAW